MKSCPRCGRNHTGLCGIPHVTLGFGARISGVGTARRDRFITKGKPKVKIQSAAVLKEMLREARMHEKSISDLLQLVPAELPEYDALLDRLGKIESLILQLNRQIIERESKWKN